MYGHPVVLKSSLTIDRWDLVRYGKRHIQGVGGA